ncbi:hypothetical protein ACJRO7_035644 [Eucalyptus globulus]|uniref:Uncharacterized protein n=1 Tax=Eucalyptus globulus TaxID=34317 RepID=A0ABD3JIB2_EUCGL
MRKAFALVCAFLILFALLFLPSTEARALLQKGKGPIWPPSGYVPGSLPVSLTRP